MHIYIYVWRNLWALEANAAPALPAYILFGPPPPPPPPYNFSLWRTQFLCTKIVIPVQWQRRSKSCLIMNLTEWRLYNQGLRKSDDDWGQVKHPHWEEYPERVVFIYEYLQEIWHKLVKNTGIIYIGAWRDQGKHYKECQSDQEPSSNKPP